MNRFLPDFYRLHPSGAALQLRSSLSTRVISLLLCFLVSISTLGATAAQASLFSVSEKEEISAGEQVRQQVYKEYGKPLPANHPMSQRVRALGQRFAALSERKNIPYSYEVLDNDKVLNAFAAPGGPIFLTTKLINTATNDAELAYVIGHETAHIDRKHIVKAVEKQQKVGLGVGILGAILGGRGGDIFQVFGNVAFTVWTRGYSRDQERESDIVGTRWMSQLGFDPNAAVSMLGRLGGGSGGGVSKYLSTHPDPKSRQENVRKLIESENLMDVARRSGGPRLSATDLPNFSPASFSDSDPYDNDPSYRGERYADFGGPLLLERGRSQSTVMAPVRGVAEWAGANVAVDPRNSAVVTVSQGRNSIRLRRGSTSATLNGKSIRLSAAPVVHDGLLYAPIGPLAEGVGATAALSSDNRTISLIAGRKQTTLEVPY